MKNKGLSCSREKIIIDVWGYDFDGEEKIVDVYINSLRKKIDSKVNIFILFVALAIYFNIKRIKYEENI